MPASAQENEKQNDYLIQTIRQGIFLVDGIEISADNKCYLGQRIHTYVVEKGSISQTDYEVYPIFIGTNVRVLVQLGKNDASQYQTNFVPSLAHAIPNEYICSDKKVALIYAMDGVYIFDQNYTAKKIYSAYNIGLDSIDVIKENYKKFSLTLLSP